MGTPVLGLPRLAGRLTADLILSSPQEMNAISEYQIDLRGNKISVIENTGATENQFDCIDLSDNEVVRLEGFSRLPRLRTLLLNNNRIARIGEGLGEAIPKLETLVLTGNRLTNLADVDNLAPLSKLVRLSLLDNPVTKKENYRLYVIHKLPALKLLDFSKVKQAERDAAAELYGGEAGASAAAAAKADGGDDTAMAEAPAPAKKAAKKAAAPAAAAANEGAKKAGPTAAQLTAITAAIANASTLAEVARLEKALQTGVVPSDLLGGDDAMQT